MYFVSSVLLMRMNVPAQYRYFLNFSMIKFNKNKALIYRNKNEKSYYNSGARWLAIFVLSQVVRRHFPGECPELNRLPLLGSSAKTSSWKALLEKTKIHGLFMSDQRIFVIFFCCFFVQYCSLFIISIAINTLRERRENKKSYIEKYYQNSEIFNFFLFFNAFK